MYEKYDNVKQILSRIVSCWKNILHVICTNAKIYSHGNCSCVTWLAAPADQSGNKDTLHNQDNRTGRLDFWTFCKNMFWLLISMGEEKMNWLITSTVTIWKRGYIYSEVMRRRWLGLNLNPNIFAIPSLGREDDLNRGVLEDDRM